MDAKDAHFQHSTLREHIVEHVFIGELLRTLWRRGIYDVEVLRSEFDAHGYDVVVARGPVVRHIQFKSGLGDRPTGKISIPLVLAQKTGGCAIWIHVSLGLDLGPYFFYGGGPMEPMPEIDAYGVPRRATHNSEGQRPERVNHRAIPASRFERIGDIEALIGRLLGPLS